MAKVKTNHPTLGGAPVAVKRQGSGPVDYPESDGKPLAETEIHLQQIFDLYASLCQHFAGHPDVHVSSNLLLYYEEGELGSRVAPDLMVIFGVAPGLRRTYRVWEEGKVPDVVIEVTSKSSRLEDRGNKRETYAMLGVREYYMIDPTAEYLKPPLRAWFLRGDDYIEVISQPLLSPALGLELRLVDGRLRLADPVTGQLLTIPAEQVKEIAAAHAARAEAEERAREEAEARKAADERAREEAEARKAADERARQEAEARKAADERAHQEAEARKAADERAHQEAEARKATDQRAREEAEARKAADERARMAEERMRAVVRGLLAGGMDRESVARLVGLPAHDMP